MIYVKKIMGGGGTYSKALPQLPLPYYIEIEIIEVGSSLRTTHKVNLLGSEPQVLFVCSGPLDYSLGTFLLL
jgi:hypothetical protein